VGISTRESRVRSVTAGAERLPGRATKAIQLLRLMAADPVELYDRVRAKFEVRRRKRRPTRTTYASCGWDSFAVRLRETLGGEVPLVSYERECADLMAQLAERARSMRRVPFPVLFDADPVLARLAYVLTRVLHPETVVETSVALGIVSGCVLSALERNGQGRLISIDLPPLGVPADAVGAIIPDALRSRWTLHRGTSTRLLPRVLGDLPPIGLFMHDSLFTWRNSTREDAQVLPHMADRSAIVANYVQHSRAFAELVARHRRSMHAVVAAEHKPGEQIGLWVRAA